MAKPASKPRKKANGYKMPDPLPKGLILEDRSKKKWKLGPSIGMGGFGEIYSAQEYTEASKKTTTFPYVIKIEPHGNGPLFVEMHFYLRNAKPDDIAAFITDKKLAALGMPKYYGSGSHEHKGEKYRFVVMEKYGSDIWKIFLENKRRFPIDTVFKLGVQILDVLEYIHSKGYIHGDVKGANVLTGVGKEAQMQVYLMDFGLCSHYDNKFKPDPKKAHNGTIEYLSRDNHLGVQSRRGDLEILGYNLTQWLGTTLPWEKNLSDPITVQNSKEKHMENLSEFFKACFGAQVPPAALVDYMKYVVSLKFETDPDYKKLRKILISGVEKAGGSMKSPLQFKAAVSTPLKRKAVPKSATPEKKTKLTKQVDSEQEEEKEEIHENEVINPDKKKRGRQAKVSSSATRAESEDSEPEEQEDENHRNGVINPEKKKRGRQTKVSSKPPQAESDEDLFADEEKEIKKKTARNIKATKEVIENPGNGLTAEMQRIKDKIEAKKKPKSKAPLVEGTNSSRAMRKRANVNYSENSFTK